MKKNVLFCFFSLVSVISFAAFPVETQGILSEIDTERFKLDSWAFMIGILTMPFLFLYGLPLALLFINKKNYRKSLALGWLAGFVLIILLLFAIESVQSGGLLIY